jgi:hypothetical protein
MGLEFVFKRTTDGVDYVEFSLESSSLIKATIKPLLPQCMHYKFEYVENRDYKRKVFVVNRDIVGKTEEDVLELKNSVFNFYREKGFPYPEITLSRRRHYFNKLANLDYSRYLTNGVVNKANVAPSITDVYFKHFWEVSSGNSLSPIEAFNSDEILKNVIETRIKYAPRINNSTMRRGLRIYPGVVSPYNFNSICAGALYEHFSGDGNVWDMCAGWGGRLVGALTSNKVKSYIGTEPFTKTYHGLLQICEDFKDLHNKNVVILCRGAEDFIPEGGSLDLCFTSPPYFSHERYSDETTQSTVKYPTPELWRVGFLEKMFSNCFVGLKSGGYLIINIKDVPTYQNLVSHTVDTAITEGFFYVETLKLTLSTMTKGKKVRYEPVLVFQKP